MCKAVAYKGLKQWKIIKLSPPKIVGKITYKVY